MDLLDGISGGHPRRLEIFLGAKRGGPLEQFRLHDLGEIGVGGHVAVKEDSGLCFRYGIDIQKSDQMKPFFLK